MDKKEFNYYNENDDNPLDFLYMMFPKALIQDTLFENLSLGAKVLYTMLLDRTRLSMTKENWKDSNGNYYIVFRISEIKEQLNVSERSAIKYLKELEDMGLVEKSHSFNGNYLYVKDFTSGDGAVSAVSEETAIISDSNMQNMHNESEKIAVSQLQKRDTPYSNNSLGKTTYRYKSRQSKRQYHQFDHRRECNKLTDLEKELLSN